MKVVRTHKEKLEKSTVVYKQSKDTVGSAVEFGCGILFCYVD